MSKTKETVTAEVTDAAGKKTALNLSDCTTKPPPGEQVDELAAKAEGAAKRQLAAIVAEIWPDVWRCMKDAYARHPEDGNVFSYKVGLRLVITPKAGDFHVAAEDSFGLKYSGATAGEDVSLQPELFEKGQ